MAAGKGLNGPSIIIKRVEASSDGGHHGGEHSFFGLRDGLLDDQRRGDPLEIGVFLRALIAFVIKIPDAEQHGGDDQAMW